MKVLEVSATFPPRVGGVERHVYLLSRHLSENGFEVEVFTTEPNSTRFSSGYVDGIPVKRFPSIAPFDTVYFSPSLTRALRRVESHVVHAHGFRSLPMLSAALAKRKSRFKLVVTTHLGFPKLGNAPYLFYNPVFGRMIFEEAEKIIVVCQQELEELPLLQNFIDKVEVVPNGIETSNGDFEDVYHSKPQEGLRLLSVGRLEKKKGVDLALTILAQIPNPDVTLDVVGEGPHLNKLVALANSLHIGDRVHFHGRLDNGKLADLYSQAHVLLHMSEYESFGIVLIEAMNAGVVPVATNVGGIPYTMSGESGFLVNRPVDVKGVVNLVKKLQRRKGLRQQMARKGWERVRERFDFDKVASRIGHIYESL